MFNQRRLAPHRIRSSPLADARYNNAYPPPQWYNTAAATVFKHWAVTTYTILQNNIMYRGLPLRLRSVLAYQISRFRHTTINRMAHGHNTRLKHNNTALSPFQYQGFVSWPMLHYTEPAHAQSREALSAHTMAFTPRSFCPDCATSANRVSAPNSQTARQSAHPRALHRRRHGQRRCSHRPPRLRVAPARAATDEAYGLLRRARLPIRATSVTN